MTAASTSASQPLVYKTKRSKQSWWDLHVSTPLSKFNISSLWGKKAAPGVPRSIYLNTPLSEDFFDSKGRIPKSKRYPTNQVITSKYTVVTFLPRNLFEQFRRIANIFFLAIAILQFFPKFSTISPGLVILPLLAVLAITALKDGYEDIKRHQADHKVNQSVVHVLAGPGYENANPMQAKEKTFVRGIPLPTFKSRKAKKAEKAAREAARSGHVDHPTFTTDQHHTQNLDRVRSQVSHWEDDPEAGDSPKELGWHRTRWEDLKVGDFVKVYEHEQFPADVLICATSEEEDVCYIETKNLDGETNLKSRHGLSGLTDLVSVEDCASAQLRIDMEAPEVNMFRLNGAAVSLSREGRDGQPEVYPVSLETCLLRGCVLRNTAWITGIVIFTGADSKIVQNSGGTPSKRSKVERQMNPQVLFNLTVLGLIAMVCAIVDHITEKKWYSQNAYWTQFDNRSGDNPSINGLVTFANAFITFQNVVPISLYISIEFVRTCQALFIYWDHAIKYVKNGVTTRTTARSWNLSDDLGQIEYIFSDKTGTLTQNAMVFRQCSIGGVIYKGDGHVPLGTEEPEPKTDSKAADSSTSDSEPTGLPVNREDVKAAMPKEVVAPFHDAELDKDLEKHDSEQSRLIHGFFAVLGLCHTVLAAEPEPGVIAYKAQSPDEAALVQSAADVGFVFRGRDRNILKLSTPFSEEPDEYELLQVLEFNSTRKRMSVIVRKLDAQGQLFLLVKGADNVIFDRLHKQSSQKQLRQKTDQDLQFFASEGLRTLCLAFRVLDPEEYDAWEQEYHQATVALEDREAKVDAVQEKIETNLTLLGATAIEDKLQDGVPEAISDLKRAGIKVWVATGDKLETAVAIGYTTHLLTHDTNLIIVREGKHPIKEQISEALETFFGEGGLAVSRSMSRRSIDIRPQLERVNTGVRSLVGDNNGTRPGGFSLVIDGHALTLAFDDPESNDLLLALSTRCDTVICCRVSPLQKAQIVHLIKDNLGVMCLAIGDGANDVSMIQAADVGVGISGEEGLQAVNSSDYAIAQFRYLCRLLFVHGHWSYFRNSNMILNFFYKNIIGIGVLFWFMIFCGWSTTYVFAYVYLLFWNVFWTLCPVIAIGLFDRDVDADILMALPELYRYGREQRFFGIRKFCYYILEGWYQSAVIYFFLHFTYITTTTRGDGYDVYIYEMSTTMAVSAVMIGNLFSGINIITWNWWTFFGVFIGPVLVWAFTAIYSLVSPGWFYTGLYGNDVFLFRSAAFWFGWPFVIVIALAPRTFIKWWSQMVSPTDIDTMRIVRKVYGNSIDPFTDPMLGGKLGDKAHAEESESRPLQSGNAGSVRESMDQGSARGDIPLTDLESGRTRTGAGSPAPSAAARPSFQSSRLGQLHSAMGSQVDMSTGLSRDPSRGFDFTMEEGGVAIQRMQSRLSQHSRRRQPLASRFKPASAGQQAPTSPTSSWGAVRARAGSVLTIGRNKKPEGDDDSSVGRTTPRKGATPRSKLRGNSRADQVPIEPPTLAQALAQSHKTAQQGLSSSQSVQGRGQAPAKSVGESENPFE